MDVWTIYSLGDGFLLAQCLNALAALNDPDHGGINSLIKVGLIAGMFFTLLKAAVTQAPMALQHFLGAYVAVMIMFGSSVNVLVVDSYTGDEIAVDSVPLGFGMPMSVVTNAGRMLTEMFETVYQGTNGSYMPLSGNGFADPLRIMLSLRDLKLNGPARALTESVGSSSGSFIDINRSLENYYLDCVVYEMKSAYPEISQQMFDTSTDPWTEVWSKAKFINIDTKLFLTSYSADGETYTCATGYDAIDVKVREIFAEDSQADAYLRILMGKTKLNSDNIESATDLVERACEALNCALSDVATFMLNMYTSAAEADARKKYASKTSPAAAVMMAQAEMRQTVIWASESSMFLKSAKALMAFIEMFVVATAPIMAFMMSLGHFGLAVGGKYMLTLAWIALWTPLMTLSNFFVQYGAAGAVQKILYANDGSTPIASMMQPDTFYAATNAINQWMAVGGMMFAATPGLALMLISGGGMAMNQLASRMRGTEHIDPGYVAPAKHNNPVLGERSAHSTSDFAGNYEVFQGKQYGKGRTDTPKISVGQSADQVVAQQVGTARSATKESAATLVNALENIKSAEEGHSVLLEAGNQLRNSKDKQTQERYAATKAVASGITKNREEQEALTSAAMLQAAAGISGPLSAKLMASVTGNSKRSVSLTQQQSAQLTEAASTESTSGTTESQVSTLGATNSAVSAASTKLSGSNKVAVQASQRTAVQATSSLVATMSSGSQASTVISGDAAAVGAAAVNAGLGGQIVALAQKHGLGGNATRAVMTSGLQHYGHGGSTGADVAARPGGLAGDGSWGGVANNDAAIGAILSAAMHNPEASAEAGAILKQMSGGGSGGSTAFSQQMGAIKGQVANLNDSATNAITGAQGTIEGGNAEISGRSNNIPAPRQMPKPVSTLAGLISSPSSAPASASGHAPASASGHAPASASGHAPASAGGHAPASAGGQAPASNIKRNVSGVKGSAVRNATNGTMAGNSSSAAGASTSGGFNLKAQIAADFATIMGGASGTDSPANGESVTTQTTETGDPQGVAGGGSGNTHVVTEIAHGAHEPGASMDGSKTIKKSVAGKNKSGKPKSSSSPAADSASGATSGGSGGSGGSATPPSSGATSGGSAGQNGAPSPPSPPGFDSLMNEGNQRLGGGSTQEFLAGAASNENMMANLEGATSNEMFNYVAAGAAVVGVGLSAAGGVKGILGNNATPGKGAPSAGASNYQKMLKQGASKAAPSAMSAALSGAATSAGNAVSGATSSIRGAVSSAGNALAASGGKAAIGHVASRVGVIAGAAAVADGIQDELDGKHIENISDVPSLNPVEMSMNSGRYVGNKINEGIRDE